MFGHQVICHTVAVQLGGEMCSLAATVRKQHAPPVFHGLSYKGLLGVPKVTLPHLVMYWDSL